MSHWIFILKKKIKRIFYSYSLCKHIYSNNFSFNHINMETTKSCKYWKNDDDQQNTQIFIQFYLSNDDNDNRSKIRMKTLCTLHTIFALNISQQKTIIKIHTFI